MGVIGGQEEGGGTRAEWGGTSASDLLGVYRGDDAQRLGEREDNKCSGLRLTSIKWFGVITHTIANLWLHIH